MRTFINLVERRVLVENENSLSDFYHATSTTCLEAIKQQGLLADPSNRVYPQGHNSQSLSGVYLATNFNSVLLHANNAVNTFGGKPLILIIRGDLTNMNVDEDHLRLFMQDFFFETFDVVDAETMPRLFAYYTKTFKQPPPKAELKAWCNHVLEHGDDHRSTQYHRIIDAVARKTSGEHLNFVPSDEHSVRYVGNIGFSNSPRIVGALVIDKMVRDLRAASHLPAHMLFGKATEELQVASQIQIFGPAGKFEEAVDLAKRLY